MPLVEKEPTVIIRDLLIAEWNSSNIGKTFNTSWVHTGWYDENSDHAEVSISGDPGDPTPDAMDGSGRGLSAIVDGELDCNVWVPFDRENYTSAGEAKQFRWDLVREIHRIIEDNVDGTTDDNGDPELTRIEVGNIKYNPANPPPPFRALIPVGIVYHSSPS